MIPVDPYFTSGYVEPIRKPPSRANSARWRAFSQMSGPEQQEVIKGLLARRKSGKPLTDPQYALLRKWESGGRN